jgi:hypothetical protein
MAIHTFHLVYAIFMVLVYFCVVFYAILYGVLCLKRNSNLCISNFFVSFPLYVNDTRKFISVSAYYLPLRRLHIFSDCFRALGARADSFYGLIVRVSGCRSRGPGSTPGAARFSEK